LVSVLGHGLSAEASLSSGMGEECPDDAAHAQQHCASGVHDDAL